MINWARVEELKDEVGVEAFEEVIELFLEEVDEATDRLAKLSDRSGLSDDLHFLKGAAMNLGFAEFAALCAENERIVKSVGPEAAEIEPLIGCYTESKKLFSEQLAALLAA